MLQATAHTKAVMDTMHLIVTLGLFGINILLTHMISRKDFIGRLRYIGHEMTFLSLGIVTARIFLVSMNIVFITVMIYLFVWICTLWLTQQVIDAKRVVPQMFFTIVIGGVCVYSAASSLVENFLSSRL